MLDYKKIKESVTPQQVMLLLQEFKAEPYYDEVNGVIISRTICHNHPNDECSRKLYYYCDSFTFHCYTECDPASFDIYELIIKVMRLQYGQKFSVIDAAHYLIRHIGINFVFEEQSELSSVFTDLSDQYEKFYKDNSIQKVELQEYSSNLIDNLPFIRIGLWEDEGIKPETARKYNLRYYAPTQRIVIPHYDENNRLIGIRGRALLPEDIESVGKYGPLIAAGKMYNHPLGFNLYGLNFNKELINRYKTAIIFESEKSVMMMDSVKQMPNISVAICGSSLSPYQFFLFQQLGVREIVFALDRQYKVYCDAEYHMWRDNKVQRYANLYSNYVRVSAIFDRENLLGYKDSPIDRGEETFIKLFSRREILHALPTTRR